MKMRKWGKERIVGDENVFAVAPSCCTPVMDKHESVGGQRGSVSLLAPTCMCLCLVVSCGNKLAFVLCVYSCLACQRAKRKERQEKRVKMIMVMKLMIAMEEEVRGREMTPVSVGLMIVKMMMRTT